MSQPPAQKMSPEQDEAACPKLDVLGRDIFNPVSNSAPFWQPRYEKSSEALVHLPFLFWLVENHAPLRVAQLGVGDGVVYLAVCEALDKLSLDAACWGITLEDGVWEASEETLKAHSQFYNDFSIIKTERMATAHRHFRNGDIDLLIVNAPLSQEDAELLTSKWKGLLSDRGIIVIIDSSARMRDDNAEVWLDPLLASYPGIELEQGEGLVALLVGEKQNSRIARLAELELGMAGYREARQLFRRLGEGSVACAKVEELEGAVETQSKSLVDAREEVDRKLEEVNKARDSEEGALAQLAASQAKVFDLESERDEFAAQLANAEKARAEAEKQLPPVAEKLHATEKRLMELGKKYAELEEALQGKSTDELAALQSRYRDRLADIAELGHAIARKDDELQRLKAQHEDTVLERFVLEKLGATHSRLHAILNRPHYLRANRRAKKRISEETRLVEESGLFDAEWYLATYSDVESSGVDPLKHFITHGAYELRNPGPDFDSLKYHRAYPDVTANGLAAIIHYVRNGRHEDRRTFPVGDGQ